MGIINYNNELVKIFSEGGNFLKIKINDATDFCFSDLTTDWNTDPGSIPWPRTTGFSISAGNVVISNSDPIGSGETMKYVRSGTSDSTSDFDFRFNISTMALPNRYSDRTAFILLGMLGGITDNTSLGGGFFARMDSPQASRRRLSIVYRRINNPDVTMYTRTESSLGELGGAIVLLNRISGPLIKNIRFYRFSNKLRCEWNFGNDVDNAIDISGRYCKKFVNSVEMFVGGSAFGNQNSPRIFGGGGVGSGSMVHAIIGSQKNVITSSNPAPSISVDRVDSFPAICIDTTGQYSGVDILGFRGDTIDLITKGRGEGFSDIAVTVWNVVAPTLKKTFSTVDYIETNRKEILSGHTTQFLFDNKLNSAKTGDLKRDIFINSVVKNQNNYGNINPNVFCDVKRSKTDTTHSLTINKSGYIEDLFNEDNTDFNVSNIPNPLLQDSNLFFGKNSLPTYMYNDSTYFYGRNAKFNFLDNILLTASAGETPIRDQYKVVERDTTSYYIIEVISDGTNFKVFSRTFNIITKSVGSRVRINNDVLINVRSTMYNGTAAGGTPFPLTYKILNPKPDIMIFSDKHVAALNVDILGILGFRIFYESYDKGTSWIYKDPNSSSAIRIDADDIVTFKLKNNDNFFFNFNVQDNLTNSNQIFGNYIRKDNMDIKVSIANYRNFSRLALDHTVKNITAAFDPIQKRINLILSTLDGYIEVLKSPKFEFDSIKNLDTVSSINKWRSEYFVRPFTTRRAAPYPNFGKSFGAFDSNGDLIVIAPDVNDSTTFAILRTSAMKDELNVMGRFMQSSQKTVDRTDRFVTNMFSDYASNIIVSTSAKGHINSLQTFVNIAKYGQFTNSPSELDLDEGFLYPQSGELFGGAKPSFDTTTNGFLITPATPKFGMSASGTTIDTINKPLARGPRGQGFVAEWQSFTEPVFGDAEFSARAVFTICGSKLNATQLEVVQLGVIWDDAGNVIIDDTPNTPTPLSSYPIDSKKLRRYRFTVERTPDSSAHAILLAENLALSDYDKIVWDVKGVCVIPISTYTFSGFVGGDICGFFNNTASQTLHATYMYITRNNRPLHPERNNRLNYIGQGMNSRSFNDLQDYNGIPISNDITSYFHNGLKIAWNGLDCLNKDKWIFTFASASDPMNTITKQPFKSWKSDSDSTSCVIEYDAADQGFQFITGNIAVFMGTNFRRCFIEGHTASLLNAATVPTYAKEIFFDIDTGIVRQDVTNYGASTVMICQGKNWRPGEHKDRYIQFEACKLDATAYRHLAFKIEDNSKESLSIVTGSNRFDATSLMKYVIYDGNNSIILTDNTSSLNFWRLRVPLRQSGNAAVVGDETAQGAVHYEPYREIGEFDMGRLSSLSLDIEPDFETTIQNSVKETKFDNLSSINFEFARPRRIKKIKYNIGSEEDNMKLKQIFLRLYQTNKPVWIFEDANLVPRRFIFGRISNEPEFEEINDRIQSVSVEIEEIT